MKLKHQNKHVWVYFLIGYVYIQTPNFHIYIHHYTHTGPKVQKVLYKYVKSN